MKHIKIIVMSVCVLLLANVKAFSQIKPSLYIGFGTCTNLGGVLGIGAEIKYKSFSFSAAIGPDFFQHGFDYDVGVKLYSKYNFFGGINYGLIRGEKEWISNSSVKDYYGFTFSLGYRFTIYRHFYGMGYLGASSDYLAFMPEEKREHALLPRIGFIIGYEF